MCIVAGRLELLERVPKPVSPTEGRTLLRPTSLLAEARPRQGVAPRSTPGEVLKHALDTMLQPSIGHRSPAGLQKRKVFRAKEHVPNSDNADCSECTTQRHGPIPKPNGSGSDPLSPALTRSSGKCNYLEAEVIVAQRRRKREQ